MPSARDCYPNGSDRAPEQDEEVEKVRGGREGERTRGRREKDGIGAEVSSVQSSGLCRARPALPQGGGSWF